jgi:pimeloyl-ACP methyl ester carboxylesterase
MDRRWLWVTVVAALTAASAGCGEQSRPEPPGLRLAACTVAGQPARCGTLRVYENRATNSGRLIDLRVTVVAARGPNRQPDPVFWLSGGPGGAATEDAPDAARFLAAVNTTRDLVFVDQRGTGGSSRLMCPRGTDARRWPDELRACLAGLNADPRAYTTAWAMDDVDDARAALGYQTVNLYGGSYGATAAQVYLQRHPSHVRSATMVGGSLLDVPLLERYPANSQRALDRLFARCAADRACRAAYPDPAGDLRKVTARLDAGPVELPVTGKPLRFTRQDLGPGLHNMLRDPQSAAMMPRLLHSAAGGDWTAVADAVAKSVPDAEPSWVVMNLTILCDEPWATLRPAQTRAAGTRSYLSYEDVRALSAPESVCAAMPRPEPAALYDAPTVQSTLMLFINGAADPQDPPENVASAPRLYPQSIALTAQSESHNFLDGACLSTVVGAFVETASTKGLPVACLAPAGGPAFDLG